MKRSLALALGSLALGALAVVPSAPAVAAETCRGQDATHVGSVGSTITGTEGHDVVVTKGARTVETLGGDDVVCVTLDDDGRAAGTPTMDTGAGDDTVQTFDLTPNNRPRAYLGDGADTYLGGPQVDEVWTAPLGDRAVDGWWTVADGDRDVVDTRAGDDHVIAGEDEAVGDRIDLGTDGGVLRLSGDRLAGDGRIALGSGSFLQFQRPGDARTWVVDGTARTATVAGADDGLTWDGRAATVEVLDESPVRYRGSAAADHLRAALLESASMGGGADTVSTTTWETALQRRVWGGSGADALTLVGEYGADQTTTFDTDLLVEAATGTVSFSTHPGEAPPTSYAPLAAVGVERYVGEYFNEMVMRGSPGADHLVLGIGVGTVYGGGGDDRVVAAGASTIFTVSARLVGGPGRDVLLSTGDGAVWMDGGPGDDSLTGAYYDKAMLGGDGDDVLRGGPGPDVLYGQAGDDVVNGGLGPDRASGGPGRDRCVAERRSSCER